MSTVFEMRDSNDRREHMIKRLEVYTDSDLASDQVTRKSTSGAVIMTEGMRLHAHSRDQGSVAHTQYRENTQMFAFMSWMSSLSLARCNLSHFELTQIESHTPEFSNSFFSRINV